jgi:hypothetical protein
VIKAQEDFASGEEGTACSNKNNMNRRHSSKTYKINDFCKLKLKLNTFKSPTPSYVLKKEEEIDCEYHQAFILQDAPPLHIETSVSATCE